MKSIAINKLLPHVRRVVLQEAARGHTTVPLTWLTLQVTPDAARFETRGKMTGWSPKKLRGHVQRCLTILAHERLLFTRTAPEGGVQPYEHGERDKRFRIRVSQEQAARLVQSK